MNDQIFEVVITTQSADGKPHVAPMGIRYRSLGMGGATAVLLMPFRPSTTLDNILATGTAVLNRVLDGRVFAGCVTGRRQWPLLPAERINGQRLAVAQSHLELQLRDQGGDPERPTLTMAVVHEAQHAPFLGQNRAQAAVVEAAVLVSRLHLLPLAKITTEMAYLQIAIDKTAGPEDHEAWGWLTDAVAHHAASRASNPT